MPLSDETELNTMSNDIIVYGGSWDNKAQSESQIIKGDKSAKMWD